MMTTAYQDCNLSRKVVEGIEKIVDNVKIEDKFDEILETLDVTQVDDKNEIVETLSKAEEDILRDLESYEKLLNSIKECIGDEKRIVQFKTHKAKEIEAKIGKVEGDSKAQKTISESYNKIEEGIRKYEKYEIQEINENSLRNLSDSLSSIKKSLEGSEKEINDAYDDAYQRCLQKSALVEDILERNRKEIDTDKIKEFKTRLKNLGLEKKKKKIAKCLKVLSSIFLELEKLIEDVNLKVYRCLSELLESEDEVDFLQASKKVASELGMRREMASHELVNLVMNNYVKGVIRVG